MDLCEPDLHCKFQARQSYLVRPCQKNKNRVGVPSSLTFRAALWHSRVGQQ